MKKIILFTVVFVFSFYSTAQTAIQNFSFDGTLSNTSNTISFFGDAKYVKDRKGSLNSALRVTNTVIEASMPNLPLSNSQRTISIWVKYNDIALANYLWGYGSLSNAQYFGLLQQNATNSKSDLNLASWGPTNDVIVTTTIASGIWYNYTVTYDGLTSKIYRNGELIKSCVSPRKLTSSINFEIGKIGTAISMNADIDDLKIYDIALSANEIAAMYSNDSMLVENKPVILSSSNAVMKNEIKSLGMSNLQESIPREINIKMCEVYSSEGQKVLDGDQNGIDIATLPEGTYLLKVINLKGTSNAKKLTVN